MFHPLRRYEPLWRTNPFAIILITISRTKINKKIGSVKSSTSAKWPRSPLGKCSYRANWRQLAMIATKIIHSNVGHVLNLKNDRRIKFVGGRIKKALLYSQNLVGVRYLNKIFKTFIFRLFKLIFLFPFCYFHRKKIFVQICKLQTNSIKRSPTTKSRHSKNSMLSNGPRRMKWEWNI